jgi:hypothetical protein
MSSQRKFEVLSAPHDALIQRAQAAKERLGMLLAEGRRDVLAEQAALAEYQVFLAAADYLVGYDTRPKFAFVIVDAQEV